MVGVAKLQEIVLTQPDEPSWVQSWSGNDTISSVSDITCSSTLVVVKLLHFNCRDAIRQQDNLHMYQCTGIIREKACTCMQYYGLRQLHRYGLSLANSPIVHSGNPTYIFLRLAAEPCLHTKLVRCQWPSPWMLRVKRYSSLYWLYLRFISADLHKYWFTASIIPYFNTHTHYMSQIHSHQWWRW